MKLLKTIFTSLAINLIVVILFGFIAFLFSGAGHGSFAPVCIFFGWAFWILKYIPSSTVESSFYILPFLQFAFYGLVWAILFYKKLPLKMASVIPAFHFLGVILSLFSVEGGLGGHLMTTGLFISSLIISTLLIIGYWIIFIRSLTRG